MLPRVSLFHGVSGVLWITRLFLCHYYWWLLAEKWSRAWDVNGRDWDVSLPRLRR